MSTTTLPQLQVLLDNAHSFPAPTPPNSATTSSSDSPDSAKALTAPIKSKRSVNGPSPTSVSPRSISPAPNSISTTPTSTTGKEKAPDPSPLSLIKPPPTPRPWSWQCHRCYAEYKVACTRRCFECGHEFCTADNNASKRGPCRAQFDFAGWEAWGSFRRTIAQLASGGQGSSEPGESRSKRRGKGEGRREGTDTISTDMSWAPSNSSTYTDAFATWTPATEVIHDLRRGWVSSIIETKENATSMSWTAVTAEEREKVTKRKEKMCVRREYNCWLHCDAPSECRLSVYTACFEGRARLVGNGKLTAVLLEDLNNNKKKKKKKERKERVKKAAKLVSMLVDTSDEDGDDESGEEEGGSDKECVIIRKLRNKKNRLLYGGNSSGGASERRPSTEITTEHVEDRQAEHELPTDGILKSETTERDLERTTGAPRQVGWPSTEGGSTTSKPAKPGSLLATLISGSEGGIDLGSLPDEKDHEDEVQNPDVDFAGLVRVGGNLAQNTGNITSTSSSATTTLVSPPTSATSFNIIRIDDADHRLSAGSQQTQSRGATGPDIYFPPSVYQPAQQAKGFVDLKEVIDIQNVEERAKRRKRQRSEHSQSQMNQEDPEDIFSPSPQGITFRFPIWEDEVNHDNTQGDINNIMPEHSAADLMGILDEGSSESRQSSGSNSSSGASSPSPATTAESSDNMGASVSNPNRMEITTSSFENCNGLISPLSPGSSQEYPSFSPVSPLDPESKMNNDLSMYLDDEIISPVSIAAARSLSSLAGETALRSHGQGGSEDDARNQCGNNETENPIASRENVMSSGDNKRNQNLEDNECEVLLTLRKMQSAFMGSQQQGRHW